MNNLFPGLRKFSEKVFPKEEELFKTLAQGQNSAYTNDHFAQTLA